MKGYAAQESKVLTEVIEARAKATQMQIPADVLTNPEAFKKFQEVQGQLSGALGRLLAVSEKYPDLKSNQNFLALQAQLEGTENRIAIARRDYIAAVQDYNTELRTNPRSLVACDPLSRRRAHAKLHRGGRNDQGSGSEVLTACAQSK